MLRGVSLATRLSFCRSITARTTTTSTALVRPFGRTTPFPAVRSHITMAANNNDSTKVKQPEWHKPINAQQAPELRLLNSLTKTKVGA